MRYYSVKRPNFTAAGFCTCIRRVLISNKAGKIKLLINHGHVLPFKHDGYARQVKTIEGYLQLAGVEFDYYFKPGAERTKPAPKKRDEEVSTYILQ